LMVYRGGKATGVGAKKRESRREQGKEPMLPCTFDNTSEPQRGRSRPLWLAYIQTAAHRAMQTASANKCIDGPAGRGVQIQRVALPRIQSVVKARRRWTARRSVQLRHGPKSGCSFWQTPSNYPRSAPSVRFPNYPSGTSPEKPCVWAATIPSLPRLQGRSNAEM